MPKISHLETRALRSRTSFPHVSKYNIFLGFNSTRQSYVLTPTNIISIRMITITEYNFFSINSFLSHVNTCSCIMYNT